MSICDYYKPRNLFLQ